MINTVSKPFHVIFWPSEDREGAPAARLEFDSLGAASAAFEEGKSSGQFRSGTLIHWRKVANEWQMIDRFPQ